MMDYSGFKAVSLAAKDCAAPARCIIQGTKGYILQKSTPVSYTHLGAEVVRDGEQQPQHEQQRGEGASSAA